MPDPILILEVLGAAAGLAAAVAALVFLLSGWLGATPRPVAPTTDAAPAAWASAGGVLGVGLGFFAGCWLIGIRPHWPPGEDQDRLLLILFPTLLGIELGAAFLGRFRRLAWLPRLVVAGGAGWILLHNTVYVADLAGPGTREWTPAQAFLILGGLAAGLAGVWAALALLARRAPGRSVPLAVALACGGAAVTIMLSGYASGGQIGLVLAAALAGALAVSLVLAGPAEVNGVLGLGVVGLFALLVIGRFFGQLTTGHAVLLFLTPLLCWLPELRYVRRVGPRLCGFLRLVLVAAPLVVVVALAQQKFVKELARTSSGSEEPSIQDYSGYGK